MNTNHNAVLPARQMPPIKLDNLLINFTTEFDRVWDTKSLRSSPASFWHPNPSPDVLPGYFPLGDLVASGTDNINGTRVAAVVCEGHKQSGDNSKGNALSRPDNFELVWRNSGSGAKTDTSIWRPIPPAGYVALGLVCSNDHEKPSFNAVRCVRMDLVIAAGVGDLIWDDKNSRATQNFSAWSIEPPTAAAGEIYFAPGTFVGFQSHNKPSTPFPVYALRMQIPLQVTSHLRFRSFPGTAPPLPSERPG